MSDYISRKAAIDALAKWNISPIVLSPITAADVVEVDKAQKEIDYWHDKAQSYEQTILKLSLNKADVVEVVRCKDCKWFNNIGCAIKIVDDSDKPKDNDYCSFGERADK